MNMIWWFTMVIVGYHNPFSLGNPFFTSQYFQWPSWYPHGLSFHSTGIPDVGGGLPFVSHVSLGYTLQKGCYNHVGCTSKVTNCAMSKTMSVWKWVELNFYSNLISFTFIYFRQWWSLASLQQIGTWLRKSKRMDHPVNHPNGRNWQRLQSHVFWYINLICCISKYGFIAMKNKHGIAPVYI